MTQAPTKQEELVPLSKIERYQSVLTLPALRWHRFMNTNGFNEKVCCKFGRKVLIHLPSFFAWLEESVSNNNKEFTNG